MEHAFDRLEALNREPMGRANGVEFPKLPHPLASIS
jgi:hypothetical protein